MLTHLVVAAYSCPGLEVPAMSAVTEKLDASMADCSSHPQGEMDPDRPLLCKAHCDADEQSPHSGAAGLLTPGAAPMPVLLWVLSVQDSPTGVLAPVFAPVNGPPGGAPPLYLSLLVLRN
ncbi:MAG: hypothetical protein U5L05_07195 [Rubrivivax sp.]|nr:hypothetical protein [Rubrivivax sp.]